MLRFSITALGLLALAACVQTEPPAADPGDAMTCPAADYQDKLGQSLDDVPFDWPSDKLRIVGIGQPVTTDYRPDRMTVTYGRNREILLISCG
jgi:hypothetical protein